MEIKKVDVSRQPIEGGGFVIKRNAVKCLICGDIIESRYRHDFVTCSCGNVSVDGGHSYLRRVFIFKDKYEDVSETEKS